MRRIIEIPVRLWDAIVIRADEKNMSPEKWIDCALNEAKGIHNKGMC